MSSKKKKTKVPKSQAIVPKFCLRVIDDVVANMRQAFLDDGVGEQALQRMLHMWRSKMKGSTSIDLSPAIPPPQETVEEEEPSSSDEPSSSRGKRSFYIKQEICDTLGTDNQLDGTFDDSDDEDNGNNLEYNDDDDNEEQDGEAHNSGAECEAEMEDDEEEPLNSADDLTDDEEIEDKFDTDNMVACQYDVVSRSRNKWKFIFRDGMMKIHGKDFMFKRAEGDAVW